MKRIPEMLVQVIFWMIMAWGAGVALANLLDAAIIALGSGGILRP